MASREAAATEAVLRVDIAWAPEMLGGPAQAIIDVFRTINNLAAMREPRRQPPVIWRWVHACGSRMPVMWPRSAGYRGVTDLLVIPGWHAHDGPHLDRLVNAAAPLALRASRIHRQGGQILSVFTGTALVAATGLLRGRQAVGPWPFLAAILRQDETLRTYP